MKPFEGDATPHQPTPHFQQTHCTGKKRVSVRINVAAHQEKKENENAGKREAGERKK